MPKVAFDPKVVSVVLNSDVWKEFQGLNCCAACKFDDATPIVYPANTILTPGNI